MVQATTCASISLTGAYQLPAIAFPLLLLLSPPSLALQSCITPLSTFPCRYPTFCHLAGIDAADDSPTPPKPIDPALVSLTPKQTERYWSRHGRIYPQTRLRISVAVTEQGPSQDIYGKDTWPGLDGGEKTARLLLFSWPSTVSWCLGCNNCLAYTFPPKASQC